LALAEQGQGWWAMWLTGLFPLEKRDFLWPLLTVSKPPLWWLTSK